MTTARDPTQCMPPTTPDHPPATPPPKQILQYLSTEMQKFHRFVNFTWCFLRQVSPRHLNPPRRCGEVLENPMANGKYEGIPLSMPFVTPLLVVFLDVVSRQPRLTDSISIIARRLCLMFAICYACACSQNTKLAFVSVGFTNESLLI